MSWLVWFAYYSEQANVGIVKADTADEARRKFWSLCGDPGHWPASGVHATPALPGQHIVIEAPH